jgi:hypothetical protein
VGLFGGKLPEVSIQLERADGVYYPGETVRASVTVTAEDGAKFKEIRAGLLFEERYQIIDRQRDSDGDVTYNHVWRTNEQWFGCEQLASNGLPKGFRQTYNYEWRLPDNPQPFCQAKILVARWLVKATVDRTLARDVNAEAPLYVVVPAPAQVSKGVEAFDENTAPDAVSMRFQLPRLEYVQGETINGRVIIEPRQDLSPSALNVSLLRHEVVPGGDRTNIENVFEAQQQHNVQLRAGQPHALDFAFVAPPKWCPSYASGNASVAWRVNATLDLPWKRDIHAWQTVRVFNGAPRAGQQQTLTHETQPLAAEALQPSSDAPANSADEAQTPKFCRSCGSPLASGALFCGNCGTQAVQS